MVYWGAVLRREYKYILPYSQYIILKHRIRDVLALDRYSINGGYSVRSVYFDDIQARAYNENLTGVSMRKKYRIRIYNGNDNVIKLERKFKVLNLTGKNTQTISRNTFENILENREIISDNGDLLTTFLAEKRANVLRPVITVDYDREAFVCEASNLRVTFDSNLRAGLGHDIFDAGMQTFDIFHDRLAILEIKYDNFIPQYIRSLLSINDMNPIACSKFTLCNAYRINMFSSKQSVRR